MFCLGSVRGEELAASAETQIQLTARETCEAVHAFCHRWTLVKIDFETSPSSKIHHYDDDDPGIMSAYTVRSASRKCERSKRIVMSPLLRFYGWHVGVNSRQPPPLSESAKHDTAGSAKSATRRSKSILRQALHVCALLVLDFIRLFGNMLPAPPSAHGMEVPYKVLASCRP